MSGCLCEYHKGRDILAKEHHDDDESFLKSSYQIVDHGFCVLEMSFEHCETNKGQALRNDSEVAGTAKVAG